MAKTADTSRVLRSIVSPALGLSLGALVAAGAAAGCGTTAGSASAEPVSTDKMPAPGIVAVTTAATPEPATSTSSMAAAPATTAPATSGTAATTASAVAGGTARSAQTVLPVGTSVPRNPPTADMPKVGTIAVRPGTVVAPAPIPRPGKVAAPGLAPSSTTLSLSTERPTRPARRATDPDLRTLRQRGRSLV